MATVYDPFCNEGRTDVRTHKTNCPHNGDCSRWPNLPRVRAEYLRPEFEVIWCDFVQDRITESPRPNGTVEPCFDPRSVRPVL